MAAHRLPEVVICLSGKYYRAALFTNHIEILCAKQTGFITAFAAAYALAAVHNACSRHFNPSPFIKILELNITIHQDS